MKTVIGGGHDCLVEIFDALEETFIEERGKGGILREVMERSFKIVFARWEHANFLGVYGADGELDFDDEERFKAFALGFAWGNWLGTDMRCRVEPAISEHEMT